VEFWSVFNSFATVQVLKIFSASNFFINVLPCILSLRRVLTCLFSQFYDHFDEYMQFHFVFLWWGIFHCSCSVHVFSYMCGICSLLWLWCGVCSVCCKPCLLYMLRKSCMWNSFSKVCTTGKFHNRRYTIHITDQNKENMGERQNNCHTHGSANAPYNRGGRDHIKGKLTGLTQTLQSNKIDDWKFDETGQ
jgi:hypothetical protein